MRTFRIAVAGSVGSGKTTFVQTLGGVDVVQTERPATDETALLKATTTVALDFCQAVLEVNQRVQVYGLPGQPRFDFMREIIPQHMDAYLVLLAAHREEFLPQTRHFLDQLRSHTPPTPQAQPPLIVVGITHTDAPEAIPVAAVVERLGADRDVLPYLVLDPRCHRSSREALLAITALR